MACYLAVLGKTASAQKELDYVLAHDETGEFYEMAMEDDELKGLTVKGKKEAEFQLLFIPLCILSFQRK